MAPLSFILPEKNELSQLNFHLRFSKYMSPENSNLKAKSHIKKQNIDYFFRKSINDIILNHMYDIFKSLSWA